MKEIIKRLKIFGKENKPKIINIVTVIVCITLIVLVGTMIGNTFIRKDSTKSLEKEAAAGNVLIDSSDTNKEEDEGKDQQPSNSNKETDPSTENQPDETSNDSEDEIIEVEKAPVNDAGDPQNNSSSGASMDISNIGKEDKGKDQVTYGIDVSKWQGVIDWKKVKESGVDFAMIRVGYRTLDKGIIQEDPYAQYNLQQAQANGIKLGVYFFSTAVSKEEATQEAKWLTDFIAPYKITYPIAYNCEGFTNPSNRQYGLSKEERTNLAEVFLDYVNGKGYSPMFYASKSELDGNSQWNASRLASKYKIWVAQYPGSFTSSSKSSYLENHHMWQYTSNGQVAGISKPVDLNVAYFGYDKEAVAKSNTPVETVTPPTTAVIDVPKVNETSNSNIVSGQYFSNVNEQITAKEVVNLRSVPSSESKDTVKGQLKNGEIATRTGNGDLGWSRLEIDGATYYVISSYITTDLTYKPKEAIPTENNGENDSLQPTKPDKPTLDNPEAGMNFTSVNEQVTAKELTNLRLIPSQETNDIVAEQLKNGDIAIRTGIDKGKGWSRLVYKDKTLYAVSSYLQLIE